MKSLMELRKDRGYSQERLAEEMDVDQPRISVWENRKTIPTLDSLRKLRSVLELNDEEAHELMDWFCEPVV